MNLHNLLLTSFLCTSLAASAQISLSQTDIGSSGTVVVDQGTSFSAPVPSMGTNQIWDFTSVGDSLYLDTTTFLLPSATPFASVMTGSNLASKTSGVYTYYEKSAAGFYLKGISFELPPIGINLPFTSAPFNFTPKLPIVKFPGNFGQTNNGTAEGNFVFDFDTTVAGITITKVKIILTVTLKDTLNGWGDAVFASGALPCLRQSQSQLLKFTFQGQTTFLGQPVWVPLPLNFPDMESRTILFWANGKNAPIATIGLDTNGNMTSSTFQRPLLITESKGLQSAADFDLYPNPAQTKVQWSDNIQLKNVKVFSADGRKILNQGLLPTEKGISLEIFPNGLYWLKAESQKGDQIWKKLIINK